MQEVRSFQLHSADENDDEMDLSDDENTASSSKRARIDKTKKKVKKIIKSWVSKRFWKAVPVLRFFWAFYDFMN